MNKAKENSLSMKTIHVKNRDHVLIKRDRSSTIYPEPNYRNTNMALVGILKHGQSLDSFKSDWVKRKIKN